MKRTSEAIFAGICIASLPACFETAYGGPGLFEPPVTQMALVDPRPAALVDSPSGEWHWADGGWRWYPRAAVATQPIIPPPITMPPKEFTVRVNLSITSASRGPVAAAFDVTARGTSTGSMPNVSAQFTVTRTDGASSMAAASPAPSIPMNPVTRVDAAASRVEPMPPVTAFVVPVTAPATGTPVPATSPIPTATPVPVVTRIAGPEEIRSAPPAGEISTATDGHDVAVTVVPMRASSPRWRRAGVHGF